MKKLLYVLLLSLAVGNVVAANQRQMLSNIQDQLKTLEAENAKEEVVVQENEKGKLEVAKEKLDNIVNFVVNDVVKSHPYMSAAVAGTLTLAVVSYFVKPVYDHSFVYGVDLAKWSASHVANGAKAVDEKTGRFGWNRTAGARAWAADNKVTNAVSSGASATKGFFWDNRGTGSIIAEGALTVAVVAAGVVYLYKYLKANKPELLTAINDAVEEGVDADLDAIINYFD
ncbi:MAG: hypothetical protein ABIA74_01295 [bacterium]